MRAEKLTIFDPFRIFTYTLLRSMRLILIAICALVLGTGSTYAQMQGGQLTPAAQAPVIVKPKLKLADVKALILLIAEVDIRGQEVDAYLDTKKALSGAVDAATKAGTKDDGTVVLEMRAEQVQNLFMLMQRSQLKGAAAEKFKEIVMILDEAAKEALKNAK